MNKSSFTRSLQTLIGTGVGTLCAVALVGVTSIADAAPHRSHGGGLSSHSSVSINVGNRGHGGHYRSHYRGGHSYYGGYGWRGHGYRSHGWGGWGGLYTGLSLGLAIPLLANGYSSSWYGGSPYYYADDVYYVSNPRRDYRVLSPSERVITEHYVYESPSPEPVVAAPPASGTPTPSYARESAPAPTLAPTPAPPPSSPTQSKVTAQTLPQLYAYPKNGQTATQSTFDRIECERWGSGQTGYSPGQSAEDANRKADYQRAVSACLEGRGYTVK
jgi:hypothetical protein